ncbi:MAG: serine/threonine-protein kinase [Marmoricola sp.]
MPTGLGVVHRDIKPGNILVERTPDMVRAYLCDFGIARLDNESHTQTGFVIGSYGYMSPEQCRGESATEASDLYALGCVLVACLVGRAPYPGTDIEVATQHLTAPAPYWEGTDPVTTVLNQTVAKLMAKELRDRYPNAQAVKAALINARRVVQGSIASQADPTQLGATVVRPQVSNTVVRPNPPALPPMSPSPMGSVGVTQVRSSIPSHDPQPASFGPTPPKAKTNTPIIVIGAAFALLLIVVTATVIIVVNKNDDNTSSTTTPVTTKTTPTQEPTPPATSSATRAGDIPENPLGLSADYANLPCDGQYIVMLGTTGLPYEYRTKLPDSIKGVNGAKYLRASESCAAFKITTGQHGDPVYNTYSGPYADLDSACQALHSMSEQQDTAWVRQVAEGAPDRLLCMCNASTDSLPIVDPAYGAATPSDMKYVSDMQYVLYKLGFNPERRLSGRHSRETEGLLMDYQSNAGLVPDGILGVETWRSLQADWCDSQ